MCGLAAAGKQILSSQVINFNLVECMRATVTSTHPSCTHMPPHAADNYVLLHSRAKIRERVQIFVWKVVIFLLEKKEKHSARSDFQRANFKTHGLIINGAVLQTFCRHLNDDGTTKKVIFLTLKNKYRNLESQ